MEALRTEFDGKLAGLEERLDVKIGADAERLSRIHEFEKRLREREAEIEAYKMRVVK